MLGERKRKGKKGEEKKKNLAGGGHKQTQTASNVQAAYHESEKIVNQAPLILEDKLINEIKSVFEIKVHTGQRDRASSAW